mmetsp:Transcript_69487/g.224782  ORF Transcript_69487/g.224782 Transcript_69487/m.224782 type:complete len:283 (+) Transcript_69487:295-1143(+)
MARIAGQQRRPGKAATASGPRGVCPGVGFGLRVRRPRGHTRGAAAHQQSPPRCRAHRSHEGHPGNAAREDGVARAVRGGGGPRPSGLARGGQVPSPTGGYRGASAPSPGRARCLRCVAAHGRHGAGLPGGRAPEQHGAQHRDVPGAAGARRHGWRRRFPRQPRRGPAPRPPGDAAGARLYRGGAAQGHTGGLDDRPRQRGPGGAARGGARPPGRRGGHCGGRAGGGSGPGGPCGPHSCLHAAPAAAASAAVPAPGTGALPTAAKAAGTYGLCMEGLQAGAGG